MNKRQKEDCNLKRVAAIVPRRTRWYHPDKCCIPCQLFICWALVRATCYSYDESKWVNHSTTKWIWVKWKTQNAVTIPANTVVLRNISRLTSKFTQYTTVACILSCFTSLSHLPGQVSRRVNAMRNERATTMAWIKAEPPRALNFAPVASVHQKTRTD